MVRTLSIPIPADPSLLPRHRKTGLALERAACRLRCGAGGVGADLQAGDGAGGNVEGLTAAECTGELAVQGFGRGSLGESAELDAPGAGAPGLECGAAWLFPGEGRGPGGAPAPVFVLGWAPAFAGELFMAGERLAGAGAAFALAAAIATPFLRASSGSTWSSWARVSFAGARPCAAARLT